MFGLISSIRKHSLAENAGILPGEKLCLINGVNVNDIIELSFYTSDYAVDLVIEDANGNQRNVHIDKYPDEDLGIEFESAVFDKVHTCYNNCVFCFVDQMIPGMRKTLYVRDDDYRLSFLYGNFITLTNMKEEDFQRIINTNLTPLYISVHATDQKVRCKMMHNRFAGDILEKMQRLIDAGIQIHTQIVCCPDYNDGEILKKTFTDLYSMYPGVLTMAIVPVGLTKHREHLTPMRSFSSSEAAKIVDLVTEWQKMCRQETNKSFVYLGDEFYLLANKELPPAEWYDGFPQIENGIGLTRNFLDEWTKNIKYLTNVQSTTDAVIVIGESAEKVLTPLINDLNNKLQSHHKFLAVKNSFFGGKVNVTGLLTGQDILVAAANAKRLIIPSVVLNNDNLFLDDMSFDEFKNKFAGKVELAKDAKELFHLLTIPKEG